ncbi:MAG: ATP-binding protein [Chitinophagaceae bacterium]|nr:ATP-binding protein [Chitinophagaceae bacterium]
MASSDQIKSLIKSFGQEDEDRFFASAMQIAASEARQGHASFAQELKALIEDARKNRSLAQFEKGKIVSISPQKRELSELIDIFQPRIKLSDMVLEVGIRSRLEKLITEQNKLELLLHHNLTPRRKLLLTGAPGTGKTMTAQAIAGELGIPVFIIRLDGILSRFMGESIAKLRMIFDIMPQQRGVYLFDEFDSIGSQREQGQDIGEIKRILNSFLINIEKDQSNSIIIAATNLPELLDKALFRRFDDIIQYPLPNNDEIVAAIRKYTIGFSFDTKVNDNVLAEAASGLNYSDLSKSCEETIKEMILSGAKKLHKKFLLDSLKSRRN